MKQPVHHGSPIGSPRSQDAPPESLESVIEATTKFTPQRLTLARDMAGLDVTELAERLDMTPSAVSQFEKGRTRPKAETVIRLALALGVPTSFFAAEPLEPIALDACHFRSLRSTAVKDRRRVIAHGTVMKRLADYLQEQVNFPAEQLSVLRQTLSRLAEDFDAIALAIRDAWNLGQGPISDMVALLESKGVLPIEIPGHSPKLDAFSTWIGGKPTIFLVSEKGSGSRRRWDCAHELGHLLLHVGVAPGDARHEQEANRFAGAFLLPRTPFLAECPRRLDWNRLRALKRRWGVSLAALVRRAFDLGIYTEATYRRAYTQLNHLGWRASEPDEPRMEKPTLMHRALGMLDAAGHSMKQVAADLGLREEWLSDHLAPPDTEQISFA